ncbi:MAG: hypothetical protein ACRCS6_09775 [Turicibacter sp.]
MKTIEELKEMRDFAQTLIGKQYEDVVYPLREKGIKFRVKHYNGEPQMCTCDMRSDRLNFVIENDVITKVTFG